MWGQDISYMNHIISYHISYNIIIYHINNIIWHLRYEIKWNTRKYANIYPNNCGHEQYGATPKEAFHDFMSSYSQRASHMASKNTFSSGELGASSCAGFWFLGEAFMGDFTFMIFMLFITFMVVFVGEGIFSWRFSSHAWETFGT